MTINKNSVEQINVALLDLDKKIKSANNANDLKNLEASVDSIKRTLNEKAAGLESGKTYDINISGNAATATKATTATTAEKATNANHAETATTAEAATNASHAETATTATKVANALTVNGKTYDGLSAVDAGVQTVANGGTGVTTQADINKAFIGNLDIGTSDVTDGTEFVSSWASDNGFNETTEGAVNTPYKRQFIKVWNYIKDKISSVLGLTKDNYGGKASTAGNADTVDNYHASDLWRSNGATWNPSANVTMTPSGNDSEWSFDFRNKNGATGLYWQVWDENKQTLLRVNADDGKVYAPYGFVGNLSGKADTADSARNMYYQNFDLSALDKTKFYPLVCYSSMDFAEVAIHSPNFPGSAKYNQNRIHFEISTFGWNDEPFTLNIREYACYDNNEITIGCIGRGTHQGSWAIWLRGGLHYTCFTRNCNLVLKTSDYTYSDEVYTVGTNYYGGSNTNVEIVFTPQSTIKDGAYSSRPITAPNIKASSKMVIPIGAPSSLVDGCIWIER